MLRLGHLHHILHLHRLRLLLRWLVRHDLLRVKRIRRWVHGRLIRRRGDAALGVVRRGMSLRNGRGRKGRRVLRGSGRDVSRVGPGVLETLVLAAGQKRETDRTMITRMLIVVPYTDQIASVTCPRERS